MLGDNLGGTLDEIELLPHPINRLASRHAIGLIDLGPELEPALHAVHDTLGNVIDIPAHIPERATDIELGPLEMPHALLDMNSHEELETEIRVIISFGRIIHVHIRERPLLIIIEFRPVILISKTCKHLDVIQKHAVHVRCRNRLCPPHVSVGAPAEQDVHSGQIIEPKLRTAVGLDMKHLIPQIVICVFRRIELSPRNQQHIGMHVRTADLPVPFAISNDAMKVPPDTDIVILELVFINVPAITVFFKPLKLREHAATRELLHSKRTAFPSTTSKRRYQFIARRIIKGSM